MQMNPREREIYNAIVKRTNGKMKPTKAALRMQNVLQNNNSRYTFNPDLGKSAVGAEVGLKKQDMFIVTRFGLFLTKEAQTARGTGVLQTYVNTAFFPAVSGPPAFDPNHLQVVYNGTLETRIDKNIIFEQFSTDVFQRIPQTQQSVTIAKSQRDPQDGYADIEPLTLWNGERVNEVDLIIPRISGIQIESVVAGTDHLVVLIATGFLLSNASKFDIVQEAVEELNKR